MITPAPMTRRQALVRSATAGLAIGAAPLLAGCDALNDSPRFRKILGLGEDMHRHAQRVLQSPYGLAKEFAASDLSPVFRSNGTAMPGGGDYARHLASHFVDWRIAVTGLVARPLSLSLADIRVAPQRTQITRHDCVEGWSAIGQWTGVPLHHVLKAAGLRDAARYIVFRCADRFGDTPYYESIDLADAFHPQTLLAWRLNGAALPVANGAPVRLRVERQLGYKHAKYVTGIEAIASLSGIGRGLGGYWEDVSNYEWYAGI